MNTKLLLEISALSSLVVAVFAITGAINQKRDDTATDMLANQDRLKAADSAAVFPATYATDPLFSNYGRRPDLFAPPFLANTPMLYGQTVPVGMSDA